MKRLAVIITRGGHNNLIQAIEWARLAASHNVPVGVFIRDEAVAKMSLSKIKELTFSEGYKGREAQTREFLREHNKADLQAILREVKEVGDVKISICRDSLSYFRIKVEDLIPELDEVQTAEAFWKEEVAEADQVMTF